jgi:hypothetical protein
VAADTLSRRSHFSQFVLESMPIELCKDFNKLNLRIVANMEVMKMEVDSILLLDIRKRSTRR